jgi:transcriptional regulator with XRE-family HTH domain
MKEVSMQPDALSEWFGPRLRELRSTVGWTQSQLAYAAGVSVRAIAQWEQGIREPGWGAVLAMAKALKVGVEEFTTAPGEPQPEVKAGRPRKAAAEVEAPAEKPKRRRPKKTEQADALDADAGKPKGKRKGATG